MITLNIILITMVLYFWSRTSRIESDIYALRVDIAELRASTERIDSDIELIEERIARINTRHILRN